MKLTVRTLLAIGIVCCLAMGIVAEGWGLLTAQANDSPWKMPGFESFCAQLSQRAWWIAVLTLVQWPYLEKGEGFQDRRRSWLMVGSWFVGMVLCLGALSYTSATGIRGMQLRNTGQMGYSVLRARVLGDLLLVLSWLLALPSVLRGLWASFVVERMANTEK